MKMKILASAVSLLCFSQLSMAEVRSTVTLNGVTHTFTYATQADATAAAINPPVEYVNIFNTTDANGAVVTTKNDLGQTFTFMSQKGSAMIVSKVNADGSTSLEKISKTVIGSGTASLTELANNYAFTGSPGTLKVESLNKDDFTRVAASVNNIKLSSADATAVNDKAVSLESLTTTVAQSPFVSATVVLNGISKTYTFNTIEEATAATKNPQNYAADFTNNGVIPTSEVGEVIQYDYQGKTIVLATTADKTVVAFDGSNYFTFSGNGVKQKLRDYLVSGKGTPAKLTELTAFQNVLKASAQAKDASKVFTDIVNSVAAPEALVTSKFTLNGTERTYTFATQADALYALSHPSKFAKDFPGISSLTGAVVSSQSQGVTNTIVFLDDNGTQAAVSLDGKNYFLIQGATLSELVNSKLSTFLDTKGKDGYLRGLNASDIALVNRYLTLAGLPKIVLFDDIVVKTRKLVNDENQAATNPTAAVAGNPASLMGTMVDGIFNSVSPTDTSLPAKNAVAAGDSTVGAASFGVGVQYGHYSLAGSSADTVTVPLTYGARISPKSQVILTVPLTYARLNGSDQYQIGGGLAYKYNVRDNWILMPSVNYAYRDAGSITGTPHILGHMISGTITSKYTWALNASDPKSFKVSITNMMGYFQSMNLNTTIGGVSYQTSGNVANYVLKNGIAFGKSMDKFNVAAFFNDTQFFGSRLYFDQYDEVGLAVKPENAGKWLDGLSLSANYLFSATRPSGAGSIDGFKVNLGYQY